MRKRRFPLVAGVALAVLFTLTLAALSSAHGRRHGDRLEGLWAVQVTLLPLCENTPTPIDGPSAMIMFTEDGKVIETAGTPTLGPVPVLRVSPGLGTWEHLGGRHYTAAFKFFRIDTPANTFAGIQTITEKIVLSHTGDEFTASGTSQVVNAAGVAGPTTCNTLTGTRIE